MWLIYSPENITLHTLSNHYVIPNSQTAAARYAQGQYPQSIDQAIQSLRDTVINAALITTVGSSAA